MESTFEIGKAGCRNYLSWFKSAYPDSKIQYITRASEQFEGYDFKIKHPGKPVELVEVKTEMTRKWGNFTIERWSNLSTGRPGWAMTSKADHLVFTFLDELILYVMPMDKVRECIHEPCP